MPADRICGIPAAATRLDGDVGDTRAGGGDLDSDVVGLLPAAAAAAAAASVVAGNAIDELEHAASGYVASELAGEAVLRHKEMASDWELHVTAVVVPVVVVVVVAAAAAAGDDDG